MGGILSGLVAGVDPRIKVVMTADGGADFARGFWNGLLTLRFRGDIRKRGDTFETFQERMEPIEASRLLHGFNPDNALMFNGRYDLIVRPEQAETLARALGGTPIVWANTGQYGLGLSAPELSSVATRFLRARFFGEVPPFQRPNTLRSQTIKLGLLLGGQEGVSPTVSYQVLDFDRGGPLLPRRPTDPARPVRRSLGPPWPDLRRRCPVPARPRHDTGRALTSCSA